MNDWIANSVDFLSSIGRFLTSQPIIYLVAVFLFLFVIRIFTKLLYEY